MRYFRFVFLLVFVLVFGCAGSGSDVRSPLPDAYDAMESDDDVIVDIVRVEAWGEEEDTNFYYLFKPASDNQTKALIFYPGANVDPIAYAPPLREIAKAGYLCLLVKMPNNMAMFGQNRAGDIIDSGLYPEIDKWAVSGHSIGGAFACGFVHDNPGKVDGLVIWASYPSEIFDLSDADLDVTLIYATNNPGTNDGNYADDPDDVSEIDEHAIPYLPDDTEYVEILGGNHTQFGYYITAPYPVQKGDGIADISREDQQEQIVKATLELLDEL